jgi:hypothetical protein
VRLKGTVEIEVPDEVGKRILEEENPTGVRLPLFERGRKSVETTTNVTFEVKWEAE